MLNEKQQFWAEIKQLLKMDLSPDKALYHASLAHLVFEKIHPFTNGNGRMGRLLEKWQQMSYPQQVEAVNLSAQ